MTGSIQNRDRIVLEQADIGLGRGRRDRRNGKQAEAEDDEEQTAHE
jgi:hypothetical protein